MKDIIIDLSSTSKAIAIKLLEHILNQQGDLYITYGELSKRCGSVIPPHHLGSFLGEISEMCKENGLPLLSAIVVNGETGYPGTGFYEYFFPGQPYSAWETIRNREHQSIKSSKREWKALLGCLVGNDPYLYF